MGFFSKYGKKLTMITNSASLALFLSVLFFAYENISSREETEEVVNNLERLEKSFIDIESSLSTRYLGIFPEYIDDINKLLNEALSHNRHTHINDTVVIFEDVLHYGVLSDPVGFRLLARNMLDLSMQGCNITIVHYSNDSRQFKQMVVDELIHPELLKELKKEKNILFKVRESKGDSSLITFKKYQKEAGPVVEKYFGTMYNLDDAGDQNEVLAILNDYRLLDSILLEHNFRLSKQMQRTKYLSALKKIKRTFVHSEAVSGDRTEMKLNRLCAELDSVKLDFSGKKLDEISFADYLTFYKELSNVLSRLYESQPCVQVIPIHENIMMCCWMVDVDGLKEAIFAFPSMYSTDEIGFISKDAAIIKYINTMLRGVKSNLAK